MARLRLEHTTTMNRPEDTPKHTNTVHTTTQHKVRSPANATSEQIQIKTEDTKGGTTRHTGNKREARREGGNEPRDTRLAPTDFPFEASNRVCRVQQWVQLASRCGRECGGPIPHRRSRRTPTPSVTTAVTKNTNMNLMLLTENHSHSASHTRIGEVVVTNCANQLIPDMAKVKLLAVELPTALLRGSRPYSRRRTYRPLTTLFQTTALAPTLQLRPIIWTRAC